MRGHRIPYVEADIAEEASHFTIADRDKPIIILVIGVVVLFIIVLIMGIIKRRKEKES